MSCYQKSTKSSKTFNAGQTALKTPCCLVESNTIYLEYSELWHVAYTTNLLHQISFSAISKEYCTYVPQQQHLFHQTLVPKNPVVVMNLEVGKHVITGAHYEKSSSAASMLLPLPIP